MIKIDSNIPLPDMSAAGRPRIYPFEDMKVGDSFFIPKADRKTALVRSASSRWTATHPGWKLLVRQEEGGCRCWRVT